MDRPSKPVSRPPSGLPRLPDALARAAASDRRGHHRFDKAFPVFVQGERGLIGGIGRNITREGMFVETRDPCPMGSEVRVTFADPALGCEITAIGEVRFQCFLNFAAGDGQQGGLRGMGLKFLRFEETGRRRGAVLQ